MNIYSSERVVLFIDGPNLHATAKALGFDIDYKKLLAFFSSKARLIRAIYYTTVLEQDEFVSIRPLVDWLEYNGYTLVTKPAKEFIDSLGRRRLKGSMDVELAVDAMRLSPHIDHAILFTGDGDFRSLVAALQRQGNRVSVVSTLQAQSPMIADELRRQADQFIDLADLESVISRGPSVRRHQTPVSLDTHNDDRDVPSETAPAARAEAEPVGAGSGEGDEGRSGPVVVRPRTRRPTTPSK